MKSRSMFAGLLTAGLVLGLALVPAQALAQQGGVSGRVVDEKGNPVAGADVVISNPSGIGTTTLKTNAKGEYQAIGIPATDYQFKATKGNMSGRVDRFKVAIGGVTPIPTITMVGGVSMPGGGNTATMSAAEIEAANKKTAEMQAAFKAGKAAADAGDLDGAIAQFTGVIAKMPECDLCQLQLGDVYLKKKDEANAEKAYLEAIKINPNNAEPYSALSALYNGQKKFDDANKMSAKVTELMAASGNTDPVAILNQGIILWNQSKMPEAKAQFLKATELDAKNADAHYWLGMALVNEGNMAESGKHMQEYLALAPTGQYADTAKAILSTVK